MKNFPDTDKSKFHTATQDVEITAKVMNKIKQISEANIEDGGSGAFYIYFKN